MEEFNQLFDDNLFNIDKIEEKTLKLKDGERRMVSILFADIKGFTSLSEKLDHEEVQTLVDQLLKIFSHSVDIYGGYVDKYSGDQIMALFGAKAASEVDTQRAINAGLDMLNKVKKFNTILSQSSKYSNLNIDLSVRIGINTGMVTTGAVGKEREGDYTVYGDAVNLAARMESNAPVNKIMIPKETKLLVNNWFIFDDCGEISVKGKSEPISAFTVKSKKDIKTKHQSPFIGRSNELDTINTNYISSSKNINKNNLINNFIGITAEGGTGKSRLVLEYLKIKNLSNYVFAYSSNMSNQPYFLFISLLKDVFKISELDNRPKIKEKLDAGIKDLIVRNDTYKDKLNSILPFLGFLLNIKYEDDRLNNKNDIKNHLNQSIKTLLEILCIEPNKNKDPFIIILDDLHWIDKMSLDMLEYILNTFNISNKRNNNLYSTPLFISTYRKEFKFLDILKNNINFTEIYLKPLSKKESNSLIEHYLSDMIIDNQTIHDLILKSKGNPFFIEEWINLIKEKNIYTDTLDESRGIKNEYKIPQTINALILARIDSLEKTLKILLQKATIIGEDFFIQILSKLEQKLGLDKNIESPIHKLEDDDFIQHYINQLDHYKFKHMLTRDVAYSTILKSNKLILHKTVAEIIEEEFSDKIEVFYYDLAIHFDTSENFDKALKYLYLAAKKHIRLNDNIHAKQCLERILSIIENNKSYNKSLINQSSSSDKKIVKLYIKAKLQMSNVNLNIGKWNDAYDLLKTIKLNTNIIDDDLKYKILTNIGQYYDFKRQTDKAIEVYKNALKIARILKNTEYIGILTGKIAHCNFDIGKIEDAYIGFKEELNLFTKDQDELNSALAYGHLGMIYLHKGDFDKSLNNFNNNLKISRKYEAKQSILYSLGNIALIHNIRGQFDESIKIYNDVMAIAEDIYDLKAQGQTLGNFGIVYFYLNQFNKAENKFNKQLNLALRLGEPHMESNAYDGLATTNHRLFKYDESINFHKKAIKIEREINDKNGLASSLCNLYETYYDMGEIEKSKQSLNEGMKIFNELNNQRSLCLGYYELSKIYFHEKNYSIAIETLDKGIDFFKEIQDIPYYTNCLIQKAALYRHKNQLDISTKLLNESLNEARNIKHEQLILNINIEILINDLLVTKKENKIVKLIKEENNDKTKAYLYYYLYINSKSNKYKQKAKNLYTKLYKNENKYEYHYYLNEIK